MFLFNLLFCFCFYLLLKILIFFRIFLSCLTNHLFYFFNSRQNFYWRRFDRSCLRLSICWCRRILMSRNQIKLRNFRFWCSKLDTWRCVIHKRFNCCWSRLKFWMLFKNIIRHRRFKFFWRQIRIKMFFELHLIPVFLISSFL